MVAVLGLMMLANAFDLICSGTRMVGSERALPTREPLEIHLRIDIDARRWCDGECQETRPLVGVSETLILLENREGPDGALSRSVNRESGRYTFVSHIDGAYSSEAGQCRSLSFSGFPARRF